MKKHFTIFTVLACVLFTACTNNPKLLTDARKADIEKQVLEQWGRITAAVEKADAESFISYLSPDGFLDMYSQGMRFAGRAQYADTVKSWFGARTITELQQKEIKVSVLSEDLALLDQKSLFTANLKDGNSVRCNHMVSYIFRKEALGWMIIHGSESWKDL